MTKRRASKVPKEAEAAEPEPMAPKNKKPTQKVSVSTRRTLRPRKPPAMPRLPKASAPKRGKKTAKVDSVANVESGDEQQQVQGDPEEDELDPMSPMDQILRAVEAQLSDQGAPVVEVGPAVPLPLFADQRELLFSSAVLAAHLCAFPPQEGSEVPDGDHNPYSKLLQDVAAAYGLPVQQDGALPENHIKQEFEVENEVEPVQESNYWGMFGPATVDSPTRETSDSADTTERNSAKNSTMEIPDMQDSCDSIKNGANAENGQSLPADTSNEVFEGQMNGKALISYQTYLGTAQGPKTVTNSHSVRKATDDYVENATKDVMKPSKLLGFDSECYVNAENTKTESTVQSIGTHGKIQMKVLETVKGGQVDSVNNGGCMEMKGISTLDVAMDDGVETAVGLKGGHQQTVAIVPIVPIAPVDVALADSEVQASSRSLAGAKIDPGVECRMDSENGDFVLIAAHREPTPTITDLMKTLGKLGFSSEPRNICEFKSFALSTGTNRIVGYKFQASMQLASELNELLDDQQFPQKMDLKNRLAFGDQTRNHCFIGSQLSDDSIAHCCFYKIICRDLFIANTILIDRKGLTLQKGDVWESLSFRAIIEQYKDKAQAAFQELNKPSKHRVQKSLLENGFPRDYLSIRRSAP